MTQVLQKIKGSKRIANHLREAIIAGELPPGGKILPTKQLSEEYGVAANTAQKALSELADEGLITRRKGKGTYVSERRSAFPNQRRVSLVLPSNKHLWPDLSHNLARELHTIGLDISLYDAGQIIDSHGQINYSELDQMLPEEPKAAITINVKIAEYLANKFPACRIIVIAAICAPDFPGDIVCYDAYQTAYLGTRHLIDTGYSQIGCVYNLKPLDQNHLLAGESDLVLAGYRRALAEAELKETHVICPTILEEKGCGLEEYIAENGFPEAFFCSSDYRATGIINVAKKFGKTIPGDLALIGTHNTPWAEAYDLTSFDTDMETIAAECARLIKTDIDNPQSRRTRNTVKVTPNLFIRSSCGCGT